MARERKLALRREDPDPDMPALAGRVDVHGLGEADLLGEGLQRRLGNVACVGEDGELVAGQRDIREDVADDEPEAAWHAGDSSRERGAGWREAGHEAGCGVSA